MTARCRKSSVRRACHRDALRGHLVRGGWIAAGLALPVSVSAQAHVFTTDADFDRGVLVGVNHEAVHDQLQLDERVTRYPFLWVAKTGGRTIVRIDANTGQVLGEYSTAPDGRAASPSRTAVESSGNVWVGNRSESAGGQGSVVKIGLVIGGTRGRKNADGSFIPDPTGQYLAPPFLYSTAVDRDGDGLVRTSRGMGDVLGWPAGSDGQGGPTAEVKEAQDECILLYQRTVAREIHHVSLDGEGRLWVGGFATVTNGFDVLDGETGSILGSMLPACGGYGGLVDAGGILWSASFNQNYLMRHDPRSGESRCISVPMSTGLAVDPQGYLWNTMWNRNVVAKLNANGEMVAGFPKLTGGGDCFGVAVTPDGDVWVANKRTGDVSRLDGNGNLRKRIPVGSAPTGVAVDANGRVWVANQNSNNVVRLAPSAGADGLGDVDLRVDLGSRANPVTLGGMSGMLEVRELTPFGSWQVEVDGGRAGADWGTATWDSAEPAASLLALQVRAAEERNALPAQPWRDVANGVDFSGTGVVGRFLEIQVLFRADVEARVSPVLHELAVSAQLNAPPDCAQAAASVQRLWPPDGRMVEVEILGLADPDGDDVRCRISAITQDEPLVRGPLGQLRADAWGLGTPSAHLRARRAGGGNGRVYEIAFVAADGRGGECTGLVTVCVPHDMGLESVGEPNGAARADGSPAEGGLGGLGEAIAGENGHEESWRSCTDDGQLFDATAGEIAAEPGLRAVNYPNPFNPSTTIRYSLFGSGAVQLVIYNALGRRVRTLVDAHRETGTHTAAWDGRDEHGRSVPSGVYVYRLISGGDEYTNRMLLLK